MSRLSDPDARAAYEPHETTPLGHSRRVHCDVDYWSNDMIIDPPEGYEGRHRMRPGYWLKWVPSRGPANGLGQVACDSFWQNQHEI